MAIDIESIGRAKLYYADVIRDYLIAEPEDFQSWRDLFAKFQKDFLSEPIGSEERAIHTAFFAIVFHDFSRDSLVEVIADEFTPPFVKPSERLKNIQNLTQQFASFVRKSESLGSAVYNWRIAAFHSIFVKFDKGDLNQHLAHLRAGKENELSNAKENNTEGDEDTWEPIKIDRNTPEYTEAIEASEAALREIEGSNGYAVSEPEERNGIVSTLKGTVEAIKTGLPTKKTITEGLLKPLKYIAKKFPDATIGEIAKLAIGKVINWLSTLI